MKERKGRPLPKVIVDTINGTVADVMKDIEQKDEILTVINNLYTLYMREEYSNNPAEMYIQDIVIRTVFGIIFDALHKDLQDATKRAAFTNLMVASYKEFIAAQSAIASSNLIMPTSGRTQ